MKESVEVLLTENACMQCFAGYPSDSNVCDYRYTCNPHEEASCPGRIAHCTKVKDNTKIKDNTSTYLPAARFLLLLRALDFPACGVPSFGLTWAPLCRTPFMAADSDAALSADSLLQQGTCVQQGGVRAVGNVTCMHQGRSGEQGTRVQQGTCVQQGTGVQQGDVRGVGDMRAAGDVCSAGGRV